MSSPGPFFADPSMDALTKAVVTLAMELWVANERIENLEHLLVQKGTLTAEQVKSDKLSPELLAKLEAERTDFIARVLEGVRHAVRAGTPA